MPDRPPPDEGSSARPPAELPVRSGTLPPPEWEGRELPRSAVSVAFRRSDGERPLARRFAPRAELAALRTQLRRAAEAGDGEGERAAAVALARALAARGAELDTATRLARRALVLGEDPALREELAGWFAGLGELPLAAASLRPCVESLPPERAARMLIRVAVHLGRSGDAVGVMDALQRAAELDPSSPVPLELGGAVAAWAPQVVSAELAAQAYVDAATRREALGEGSAAFEDLLRAFEVAPAHVQAAERLAGLLSHRGRQGAADEVLREHAAASQAHGRAIHLWRMAEALAQDELGRALGAAFDARLDGELDPHSALRAVGLEPVDPEGSVGFDELVERVGLFELLGARLELAAEASGEARRGRCLAGLARLLEGPLASPEQALEAWLDALAADPANEEAMDRVRARAASARDQTLLVEAVLRLGEAGEGAWEASRTARLTELVALAEQRLADPALALWGLERLAEHGIVGVELDALRERATERLPAHAQALEQLEAALRESGEPQRASSLRRAAALLRARPERLGAYVEVLEELVATVPGERVWGVMLEQALRRSGDPARLERALERMSERAASSEERVRLVLARAALARRSGDEPRALALITPLTDAGGALSLANGLALVLAARLRDAPARARALVALASRLAPAQRGVLAAVAADELLAAGEPEAAREVAEQGHRVEPSLARPIATLARVAVVLGAPDLAVALERAMGVLVPRAEHCRALALAHERAGELELALAWTQRWLALRPGDPRAAAQLLAQAVRHGDVPRLADALGWLLAQPQPIGELLAPVCDALLRLAELDPARTGSLARRALDVMGPREARLRETILAISERIGEPGLAIITIERWLAAGMSGEARAGTLLDLSRRRRAVGDADGAARCLGRALAEGAEPALVLREAALSPPPRTSDGEFALLEVRAEALSSLTGAELTEAAAAWRQLGAAAWDLAGDPDGAVRAWQRAVALEPELGIARYARDLVTFGGTEAALARLVDFAATRGEATVAARALAAASSVALEGGRRDEALTHALGALARDPGQAEALAVVERAASPDRLEALERAYDLLAAAALGRFGERAAHYRAARQLERHGAFERAFPRAVAAFEAVPGPGVVFVLMARLAERVGDPGEMLRAIERVASSGLDGDERAEWMQRAACLTGSSVEGKRQRVEVLFRALHLRPDVTSVRQLVAAAREVIANDEEDREILAMRYARALRAVLPQLQGPEGARIALQLAEGALALGGDTALATDAVLRALACDADVEEYVALAPHHAALAADADAVAVLLARLEELGAAPWSNLGRAAAELGVALGERRGELGSAARLLLVAAAREPEDAVLAERARRAVQAAGDPALVASWVERLPASLKLATLLELAREAEARGDPVAASDALAEALTAPALEAAAREPLVDRLIELHAAAGRRELLWRLLREELARPELESTRRLRLARRLAAALAAGGRGQEGLELLVAEWEAHPEARELLGDIVTLARQVGDRRVAADALERLVELAEEPAQRAALLRELAPLLEALADPRADERWAALAELDPEDSAPLAALERGADRSGDHETLLQVLGRRAARASGVDEIRRLRLRRAQLLEERLGRHDEARAELQDLLATTGDHLSVLRVLADLDQRLGDELQAAPRWLRASAVARDRDEAAGLAQRACAAYLRGNDVAGARRVVAGMEAWAPRPLVAALRVEVERRGENPLALARALAEHASFSQDSSEKRAALLVEAARLAEAAGETATALENARQAARFAPAAAAPQLIARLLEYRQRGAGTSEEARALVAQLRGIESALAPPQVELRAFLVAEALDVAVGPAAGLRELERARAEVGERPLLALGLAERLAVSETPGASLPLFDVALGGDLRELRVRGEVALEAAHAARRAGELERAVAFAGIALAEERTRGRAQELRAALERELQPPPPPAPVPLAVETAPALTTRRSPPPPPPRVEDPFLLTRRSERPAAEEPPTGTVVLDGSGGGGAEDGLELPRAPVAEPTADRVTTSPPPVRISSRAPGEGRVSSSPPRTPRLASGAGEPTVRSSVPPPPPVEQAPRVPLGDEPTQVGTVQVPPEALASDATGLRPTPLVPGREGDARPSAPPLPGRRRGGSALTAEEAALEGQLAAGSIAAGLELAQRLEGRRGTARELVATCRRLVLLAPDDPGLLDRLHRAALADRHGVYAAALDHVRRAMTDAPSPPPPLAAQPEQAERVQLMLFGERGAVQEALALVWDGASHVFKREPSAYGVTGVERVPFWAPSPVARIYGAAARALGINAPLFQRRAAGDVTLSLALLQSPSVIVNGELPKASTEFAFHLGVMLAAAMPGHALLCGTPEEQARSVLRALAMAFGPPSASKSGLTAVATLAEVLWESMPTRSQRRLRQLCDDPRRLTYEHAMAEVRAATRRAGLFVAGDLRVAARAVADELGLSLERGLGAACASSPELFDLFRLATSPEYAEARWQSPRAFSRPPEGSWQA